MRMLPVIGIMILLSWTIAQAGPVSGVVHGNSNPLPGAKIEFKGPQTMTTYSNNWGGYSLYLRPGKYQVKVNQSGPFTVFVPQSSVNYNFRIVGRGLERF
jgi:hypothetical protein